MHTKHGKNVCPPPLPRTEDVGIGFGKIPCESDNLYDLMVLSDVISDLLGEENRDLLRVYTSRLLAQFNEDFEWLRANGVRGALHRS